MTGHGFWDDLARVLSGPGALGGRFQLRLVLQPIFAILLGVRFGLRDAKVGRLPFVPTVLANLGHRPTVLGAWLRDAIVPLSVAFVVDGILQVMINHHFRALAALFVGGLLVFLPFVVVRGATNRLWTQGRPGGVRPARQAR